MGFVVSFLYCLALTCRQFFVKIVDHLGVRDHLVNDRVNELEKMCGDLRIVLEVEHSWVNRFVADDANDVK